jgi:hypothetical protein
MTTVERIEGFACKVEESEFDGFKKAAKIADLPVYDPDEYDPKYPFYAWDGTELVGWSNMEDGVFKVIPFDEFIKKLKGEPMSMTKAEALERFFITITD